MSTHPMIGGSVTRRRPWQIEVTGESLVILNPIGLRREIDALVHSNAAPQMVLDAITRHTQRLWYRHTLDELHGERMDEMVAYVHHEGRRNVSRELVDKMIFTTEVIR
jgi:hypothetical protein